jgi:hypothetical protein
LHCQYAAQHRDPAAATIARLFPHHVVPVLAALDLSRNEPGHLEPRSLGGEIVISAFFLRFAHHPTLGSVRLPSLPHETAISAVERTLVQLPALRDVAVWAPAKRLPVHPTATIREIPIAGAVPGPKRLT